MVFTLPMAPSTRLDHYWTLSEEDVCQRIISAKKTLGDRLMILGHHYQSDEIILHADETGDSFMLAQMAQDSQAELIVFCGVHFMAESADILTRDDQVVILPNIRAGCSMADMAVLEDVELAWEYILDSTGLRDPIHRNNPDEHAPPGESFLIPVTYMNSSADLKSFVGLHGGIVCTSSNASGVLQWAFDRAGSEGKVLFFPDQHLGRNTGLEMGLDEEEMVVWTPNDWQKEDKRSGIIHPKLILWHGYCSVHKRFTVEQIETFRKLHPDGIVVVHPECTKEVVRAADAYGSTEYIRRFVASQPSGSNIAIGTEINLVRRLNLAYPDTKITCLDEKICPCSTMYMIQPPYLLDVLEQCCEGKIPNQIIVEKETADEAILALRRMLSIHV